MLEFKNNHIIYENIIKCIVRENEYNYSLNPTLQTGSFGDLKTFAQNENFQPYVTSVGLYNENNELLVISKFSQPIKLSSVADINIIIKYDE